MDLVTRLFTSSFELFVLVGAVVVILIALYAFARSIAEGQGAIVGFKKMWGVIWRNMP